MAETIERPYTSKEISITLNIGTSTLRKWCLALEKYDYTFTRNDQNQRLYFHKDLVALRHYQTMVQDNNFSLDNAAVVVSSKFKDGALPNETQLEREESTEISVTEGRSFDEVLGRLLEHIETQEERMIKLEEFNQELLKRLDQQQKYIDSRLEERDRKLLESIRESQEERKALLQIAASREEEKKKGLLSRLFGK